MHIWDVQIDI